MSYLDYDFMWLRLGVQFSWKIGNPYPQMLSDSEKKSMKPSKSYPRFQLMQTIIERWPVP